MLDNGLSATKKRLYLFPLPPCWLRRPDFLPVWNRKAPSAPLAGADQAILLFRLIEETEEPQRNFVFPADVSIVFHVNRIGCGAHAA